ncbi:MAG: hypothetical protein FJX89_03870 [Bacteroidetes bacterium]|nr:hypothetical protein [Bacteroidota bacterium]
MPSIKCHFGFLLICLLAACRVPLPPPPTTAEGDRRAFWERKQSQGIEVFAVGHEPEWSVEIDEQGDLRFHPLEGDSLRVPYSAFLAGGRAGKRTLSYHQGSSVFRITLSRKTCTDVFSGEFYAWTMTITRQYPDGATRTLAGCACRIP